jgi:sec-independent protein translocase protein TatB
MLNIGMTELLIFGIIALLVLGPEKLPEALRSAGKCYRKIKHLINTVQTDLDRELRLSELREQMQTEIQRIQALEAKMQAQLAAQQYTPANSTQSLHELKKTIQFRQMTAIPPLPPVYLSDHWLAQQHACFRSLQVAV